MSLTMKYNYNEAGRIPRLSPYMCVNDNSMISNSSELRIIKALGYKPSIKKVLHSLNIVEQTLLNRRYSQTDLKIQHQLFLSNSYDCNRILKDLK